MDKQIRRKPNKSPQPKYKSSKGKRGGHKLNVTADMRELVVRLSGIGVRVEDIAKVVAEGGVSTRTLYKYFKKELREGKSRAIATVAGTAFSLAKSGRFPSMTMFWLKCQAGWREYQREEDLSPNQYANRVRKAFARMEELTVGMQASGE